MDILFGNNWILNGSPSGLRFLFANGEAAGYGLDLTNERYFVDRVRKSFADAVTFSRASTATMVDSDGTLKWAPHNVYAYSEDWSNAVDGPGPVNLTPVGDVLTINSAEAFDYKRASNPGAGQYTARLTVSCDTTVSSVGFGLATTLTGTQDTVLVDFTAGVSQEISLSASIANGDNFEIGLDCRSSIIPGVTSETGFSVTIEKVWVYRSDLGGMVDVPSDARATPSATTYVPTTSSAVYLPRRGHHVYNGDSWVNKGLLHESEARTNLLTYSDDFTNAAWVYTGTSDEAKDADGYTPIIESATSLGHYLLHDAPVTSGVTYTFSFDVKARENTLVQIASSTGFATSYINFNLSSGTIGFGSLAATITKIGSGEYRVSASATAVSTTSGRFVIALTPDDVSGRLPNYTGTLGNGVLIRRVQLEAASTPSSYIPTSGSQVTRAAETLTVPADNLPWPTPNVIGEELVTNGTFDTDTSGWTDYDAARGTTSWDSGAMKLVNDGTGNHLVGQQLTGLSTSKVYVITFDVIASSGTTPQVRLGNTLGTSAVGIVDAGVNGTGSLELAFKPQLTSVWVQPFILGGTGSGVYATFDNISVKEIDPLAVSIQMSGEMTYADEGLVGEVTPFRWLSGTPRIFVRLRTDSTRTGAMQFLQNSGDGEKSVIEGGNGSYSPDINVPFNIASRHGSTFINGAVDGTALTENGTPTALPDLSSTDLQIGDDFMGTISEFRVWAADLGDAGIEEASS